MTAMSGPSSVARYFELEVEGQRAGFCKSVDGGAIKAEVVSQAIGGHAPRAKHIGVPQYEPFSVAVGMSMSKEFWKWIKDSWDRNVARKNGAIYSVNPNMDIIHEQSFHNALITETTLPACDASSKEPAYMNVKFMPEWSQHKAGGGKARSTFNVDQKLWLPSNFRFELGGLDCTRVNKIESFTVKQGTKRIEIGKGRNYQVEPTSLEFPNLSVTLSLATADAWFKWHEDFVVKGKNESDNEKIGSITLLSPKRDRELLTIGLKGVGISNIVVDKGDAGSDSIKRVKAELYVEEMEFEYK